MPRANMYPMRQIIAGIAIVALLAGCVSHGQGPSDLISPRSKALLWRAPFPDLVVEVDYARDPPVDLAMDGLLASLRNVTLKTNITVLGPSLLPEAYRDAREWRVDDLDKIGPATRDSAPPGMAGNGTRAIVHVVYLVGTVKEMPNAAGLSIEETAFVFGSDRSVRGSLPSAAPVPSPGPLFERAVLIHEVGHMLGLVDNGVPMVTPHLDAKSAHHSSNSKSVMTPNIDLFQAQEGMIFPSEGPPYEFDSNDLADIRHAQSLEPR